MAYCQEVSVNLNWSISQRMQRFTNSIKTHEGSCSTLRTTDVGAHSPHKSGVEGFPSAARGVGGCRKGRIGAHLAEVVGRATLTARTLGCPEGKSRTMRTARAKVTGAHSVIFCVRGCSIAGRCTRSMHAKCGQCLHNVDMGRRTLNPRHDRMF